MKRSWLKHNGPLAALLLLVGLLALAFLLHLYPITVLSQTVEETTMTAEARQRTEADPNLKPPDPTHQVALFALG